MLPILALLFTIFKIVVSFSILILIHELGHFLVAKKSGVWVEEFGLGLPPRIFGKKIGDTLYSINWLPIGGFVKLHGETSSDKVVYPEKAFTNKPKLIKIAITLAGVFMNFVLAVICFAIIYFVVGIPNEHGKINLVISDISANSPASTAGIKSDDIIEKVNDVVITNDDQFKNEIQKFKGKEVSLVLKRKNDDITVKVTPRLNPPAGEGSLGVEFGDIQENYFPPLWQRPFISIWYGAKQTVELSKAVFTGLGGIAQSVGSGQSPKGVSGPIGILSIAKRISELGMLALINFVAVVSINLAIINIVPFPPLDGSRVALVIAEWITKKKLSAKIEEKVYLVGFIILLGLMVLITSHELPALIKSGSVDKYADTLLNPK